MTNLYDLYNTSSDAVEASQPMTSDEAKERNALLRSYGEPQRWVLPE